jgi:NAD dependent epimerase/dehydratase family enzyme
VLGKPTILPVPATALKVVFGTMANETMLSSLRVLPVRLVEAGFRFEFGDIDSALHSQLAG